MHNHLPFDIVHCFKRSARDIESIMLAALSKVQGPERYTGLNVSGCSLSRILQAAEYFAPFAVSL